MRAWLSLAALLAAWPARADTLIDNVQGLTIAEDGALDRFTGLVIGSDGRIKQVLDRGETRPARPDQVIDGKGMVLMPGMIDSHGHVTELGLTVMGLDLADTRTLDEALARIAAYARANPELPWIVGRGWNQEQWGLGRFPTAAELDAVVGDRPVWLRRIDGLAGWANSRALTEAGVNATSADPVGGRIERLASGAPSGALVNNAMALVEKALPATRPEDLDQALARAQNVLLASGVTAIADMGSSAADWNAYRRAGDAGALKIRIMAYANSVDTMALIGGPGPTPWLYGDRLRLNGVKLYGDGALGSRGARLKAPYADAPGSRGHRVTDEAVLKARMELAARGGFQAAIHAIGDETNAGLLDAIADLNQRYGTTRRWRIEHAQVVDPLDIPRFGALGAIASMQPVHQTSDRAMAEKRLGPGRLAGAYAWKSLLDGGAMLAFGSDTPVEAPGLFAGWAAAISRIGPDGVPPGGWQPQERISREQALAAFTAAGAYAGFAEGRFGRLVKGEHADFLLIDRDPMTVSPQALRQTKILQVYVGGVPVWTRSDPVAMD